MLNEAQTQLFQAPQLAVYPGVAIALTVLGLNLMGDGLRDMFDPRLIRTRAGKSPATLPDAATATAAAAALPAPAGASADNPGP
jgi:hypothetical protein